MDAKAWLAYAAPMRLLLLLSALLTALSGVTCTRAVAQPVQASAAALASVPRAKAVSPAARRFVAASYRSLPPLGLAVTPPVPRLATRLLYAERRRE